VSWQAWVFVAAGFAVGWFAIGYVLVKFVGIAGKADDAIERERDE
jgi:uncharacterized membrane-anchored protein YhcB (DUF1043 family)